jgi:ABC-type branched-subunit amino acid transport system permease subunit
MRVTAFILVFLAALVFTAQANSYYVFIMATLALTAIAGIGLNILLGLTGQVSFGHVGFYAIGAYTVAILSTAAKLDFWLALPAAIGSVVGRCSRCALRAPTSPWSPPFGFVVENGAAEWRGLTGGQNGIMGVPPVQALGLTFGERGVALLAIAFCGLLTLAFWRLARSQWGAAMRAVKDSEIAAESVGLNPVAIKALAFALSAACAGLAGALFAPLSGFVTPSTFAFLQSILFVLVVIVGGAPAREPAGRWWARDRECCCPASAAGLAERLPAALLRRAMLRCCGSRPRGIVGEAEMVSPAQKGFVSFPRALSRTKGKQNLPRSPISPAFGGVKAATDVAFIARGRGVPA